MFLLEIKVATEYQYSVFDREVIMNTDIQLEQFQPCLKHIIYEINLFADEAFTVRILEHILHVGYDWSLGSYLPIRSEVND